MPSPHCPRRRWIIEVVPGGVLLTDTRVRRNTGTACQAPVRYIYDTNLEVIRILTVVVLDLTFREDKGICEIKFGEIKRRHRRHSLFIVGGCWQFP